MDNEKLAKEFLSKDGFLAGGAWYTEEEVAEKLETAEGTKELTERLKDDIGSYRQAMYYMDEDDQSVTDAVALIGELELHKTELLKEQETELTEKATAILEKEIADNPDGYEVYFDYRDKISPEHIAEAFEDYQEILERAKNENREPDFSSFEDYLHEAIYGDWEIWGQANEICTENLKGNISVEEMEIVQDYLDVTGQTLEEAMLNLGFSGVYFDLDNIVDNYKLNLILATERETNCDMGTIPDMFDAESIKDLNKELSRLEEYRQDDHFDSALTYLVQQQGHSVEELIQAMYSETPSDNAFIKSVVDEINEMPTYGQAALTVLVTLDKEGLEVLDKIAKGEGEIEVSKDAMLGLFNTWNGSGSSLEIELEKPFVIPADMVHTPQIEHHSKGEGYLRNYTVDETYGLIGKAWEGEMKISDTENTGKDFKKGHEIAESVKSMAKEERGRNSKSVERD